MKLLALLLLIAAFERSEATITPITMSKPVPFNSAYADASAQMVMDTPTGAQTELGLAEATKKMIGNDVASAAAAVEQVPKEDLQVATEAMLKAEGVSSNDSAAGSSPGNASGSSAAGNASGTASGSSAAVNNSGNSSGTITNTTITTSTPPPPPPPQSPTKKPSLFGDLGSFAGSVFKQVSPDLAFAVRRDVIGLHPMAMSPIAPVHQAAANPVYPSGPPMAPPMAQYQNIPMPLPMAQYQNTTQPFVHQPMPMAQSNTPVNSHPTLMPQPMPPQPYPSLMPRPYPAPMPQSNTLVPRSPMPRPMMQQRPFDDDDEDRFFDTPPPPPQPPLPHLKPKKVMHCFCETSEQGLDEKLKQMGLQSGPVDGMTNEMSMMNPMNPSDSMNSMGPMNPMNSIGPMNPMNQMNTVSQYNPSYPSNNPSYPLNNPSYPLNPLNNQNPLKKIGKALRKLKIWLANERHPAFSYPRIHLTDNPPPPPDGTRGHIDDYGYSL